MAGDIVILYPTIALKEGLPIHSASSLRETDDCRQMVEEHLLKDFSIEQILWRWEYFAHREIVLQFLVVEADFKAVETLGITIMVKDILLVGMVVYLRFFVVCLNRNTIALVRYGFLLL